MAAATANSQDRISEKVIVLIKLTGDLPADFMKATVDAYLIADDITYMKVASGFTIVPAPIKSDKDTEGSSVTLAVDVPGSMQILQQSPDEVTAMISTYSGKPCDIVLLYGDPDDDIAAGVVSSTVGDNIAIIRNVKPYLYEIHADATDFKMGCEWDKENSANDRLSVYETVIVDV